MPSPKRCDMADRSGAGVDEEVPIPLKGVRHDPEQVRRALSSWLAPRLGASGGISVSTLRAPAGTGVANETLIFDATWSGAGRDHTAGFVARLASDRPLYLDADLEVHARIYQALAEVADVPVPKMYGYEPDRDLVGAPFFVMERIEGQVPADTPHWRTAGFVFAAPPERRRKMWEGAVRVLAALHQVEASRFPFLLPAAGSSGLGEHLGYWRRSLDHGTSASPHDVLERGYEWLRDHLPEPAPTGFSWGDSRFANVMFRGDRVVSIFDWDTASMAGAEADLAWWRYMDGPVAAELEGIGGPDELVTRWELHTGRKAQHVVWYDTFTMFRLGVIMINLFNNMAADGHIPAETAAEQGRNSEPALALAAQLDTLE
jgi:aminoglycoside phosphotransferase (APT) family kinase protein